MNYLDVLFIELALLVPLFIGSYCIIVVGSALITHYFDEQAKYSRVSHQVKTDTPLPHSPIYALKDINQYGSSQQQETEK